MEWSFFNFGVWVDIKVELGWHRVRLCLRPLDNCVRGAFDPSDNEEEEYAMSNKTRVMIETLQEEIGNVVCISGWIHRIRILKNVVFIVVRDRTGLVQCVMSPEQFEANHIYLETVVRLFGTCTAAKNTLNPFEVLVESIEILNESEPELPFMVNGETLDVQLDTLLNHRVLSLRNRSEQAIFKVQSTLSEAFGAFLRGNDFLEIHTPKIVKEGAEGGANVFSMDYFGEKAYLAQSPQFYKQMMVISGVERVFEVGPVFRAEPHSTSRHLNEYISMDLEMGFIEDESELMALETNLLKAMIGKVAQECPKELEILKVALPKVPDKIPRMKLSEAIDVLKSLYGKTELEGDLDPEGERLIAQHVYELSGSEFLFLTHYPQYKRPMYTMPSGETETKGFDLLFRGLEITTGGLRIHKLDQLKESMKKKGLDPEAYESYLEAFKYGAPPHGGLAIGLERLTAQLLGYKNIRRTTLFPRDGQRLTP
jgi:nondiscriminating aspartyl-tRNA synthetase